MAVAGTVIACRSKWRNMRNPVGASDSSPNLMEILTWPHSDIDNGGQNNIGNMDHKITLNLQFCQEYMCVAGRKR